MEYTQNYQLPLWDKDDAIKRADFNDANSAIDAALGEHKTTLTEQAAALALCGNCKIVYGSYTGTGTYGSANPNTLTFSGKPLFVAIMPQSASGQSARGLQMVRESPITYTFPEYFASICTVSWTDTSVSWYNASSVEYQFNRGNAYHYVALLAADE